MTSEGNRSIDEMKKYQIDNLKNYQKYKGWICGHFLPEGMVNKTSALEVKVNTLKPGETEPEHFHPRGKTVIFIVKGKMKWRFDGQEYVLGKNDFAYLKERVREMIVEVYEPTTIISIRVPSVPNNKVEA
ncbi:MAG: cupin domain-containing protein [Candidatus Pacebacteria bacterium]|nr:cupin domain-containing protein [Candidatus Paceibacterota bacterium]